MSVLHRKHKNTTLYISPLLLKGFILTIQFADVTDTTDVNGYLTFTFDSHVDAVMVSVGSPQQGNDIGLVSASAVVTGDKTVKVRVWRSAASPSWTVQPAVSKQVEVTLLGLSA